MEIYDTLLLGSGYYAVGYAEARGNCLIVEEGQVADTQFYLPMRGFSSGAMEPSTEAGRRLYDTVAGMGLIGRGGLCVNGLESALARHILTIGVRLRLKCRAVEQVAEGDLCRVVLSSNAGLCTVYARRVLDTRPRPERRFVTVLVQSDRPYAELAPLLHAFPGAELSCAFYEGRYALTVPADGYDENSVKVMIWERFPRLLGVKILYIAPAFLASHCQGQPTDAAYDDPIQAYEAGYRAGEVRA